jgi:triacylglycerol lipase
MFGFSHLAGYDYFVHVAKALGDRMRTAGEPCELVVVSAPPTGFIRRRSQVVIDTIEEHCSRADGPIHLIGHSTGGLDARLLTSPSVTLDVPSWIERVRTVVTLNTPHQGTPVAYFFSTLSGTRLLYALSLFTFATLRFGGPSLTVFSSWVAFLGRLDDAFGVNIKLLDRSVQLVLRFIEKEGQIEVGEWLDGIRHDQGGVIQLTPESMDMFNASVEDSSAVRYGSVASWGPSPGPVRFLSSVRSPMAALSATLYSTLHIIASRASKTYPYSSPDATVRETIERALGRELTDQVNDGLVPTASMVWGDLLWEGSADHLDILGHFHGEPGSTHTDWLTSGAGFREDDFEQVMDAVTDFLLDGRPI